MSSIKSYRDLEVWQKSKVVALKIYKATNEFPKSEIYGITSQLRRAAISIPSNIAEGFRRRFAKEKLQFLSIAFGSGAELETQLEISGELEYLNQKTYQEICKELDSVMRMLNKIINSMGNEH